jgi:hypothetical protein
MLSCQKQYLTLRILLRYCFCNLNIKSISPRNRLISYTVCLAQFNFNIHKKSYARYREILLNNVNVYCAYNHALVEVYNQLKHEENAKQSNKIEFVLSFGRNKWNHKAGIFPVYISEFSGLWLTKPIILTCEKIVSLSLMTCIYMHCKASFRICKSIRKTSIT